VADKAKDIIMFPVTKNTAANTGTHTAAGDMIAIVSFSLDLT
jgi:hypothetical protein